jgi:hypothetical protein
MNSQKGFIQIPVLIAIIVSVIVVGGAGYVGVKQYQSHQTSNTEQPENGIAQNGQATTTQELSEVEKLREEVDRLKKQQENISAQSSAPKQEKSGVVAQSPSKPPTISSPQITSVDPVTATAGSGGAFTIKGSGFHADAKIMLGDRVLERSGYPMQNLLFGLFRGDLQPGTYDMTVVNPDGGKYITRQAVMVRPQATTVGSGNSNLTFCNGQYWNPCQSGRKLYCPTSGGEAVCVLENNNNNLPQPDLSKAANTKAQSINLLNQVLSDLRSLDTDQTNEINRMESILNSLIGMNDSVSGLLRDLTTLRRNRLISGQSALKSYISATEGMKRNLEGMDVLSFVDFNPEQTFADSVNFVHQARSAFQADKVNYDDSVRNYLSILGL